MLFNLVLSSLTRQQSGPSLNYFLIVSAIEGGLELYGSVQIVGETDIKMEFEVQGMDWGKGR